MTRSWWLGGYERRWLTGDLVAGATLAAYAIPVSLAYATMAGLSPVVGVYGYLLGGLGYALFGTSRQLALGPTSAISLMIAGSVGAMAGGDALRYAQTASLAALVVAVLCFACWLLRLSILVRLISDSVLVGFKAGAGLTIIVAQLPSFLGVPSGGGDVVERSINVVQQLPSANGLTVAVGACALLVLVLGERLLHGKPVALVVVAVAIIVAAKTGLAARGVAVTGQIPEGLPTFAWPALRIREVEGIFPLAAGCLLLAYIEGVSAARNFAAKHGYELDLRQEFLGLGAANLAVAFAHGYPVAGGLSQSAVNDSAGARTPAALVICSIALGLCLLYLTGALASLPKAVLAAVVIAAVYGLVDVRAMVRLWRLSRIDFYAAAIALVAVLLLGILQGILLAAAASVLLLLGRASRPHVAFLGRVPGTHSYSDRARHPENEPLTDTLAFRPEASLLYVNADHVLEMVQGRMLAEPGVRRVVCDLSASPVMDLAGATMLHRLQEELAKRSIPLLLIGAHGQLRDLLRADGLADKVGGLDRTAGLDQILSERSPGAGTGAGDVSGRAPAGAGDR